MENNEKMIVACGSIGGKPVLLFASDASSSSSFAQNEAYSVVSSDSASRILSSLKEGVLIQDAAKDLEGDAIGAVFQKDDCSYRLFRKCGGVVTVWNYPSFDGFLRALGFGDENPSLVRAYRPLPSVLEEYWTSIEEKVSSMAVNYDGGTRVFSR